MKLNEPLFNIAPLGETEDSQSKKSNSISSDYVHAASTSPPEQDKGSEWHTDKKVGEKNSMLQYINAPSPPHVSISPAFRCGACCYVAHSEWLARGCLPSIGHSLSLNLSSAVFHSGSCSLVASVGG